MERYRAYDARTSPHMTDISSEVRDRKDPVPLSKMGRWLRTLDARPVDAVVASIQFPSGNPDSTDVLVAESITFSLKKDGPKEKEPASDNQGHTLYLTLDARMTPLRWEKWAMGSNVPKWIRVPDSVLELCDECFEGLSQVAFVTFGANSSLTRIGVRAFAKSAIKEICIPKSVTEICNEAFAECKQMQMISFGQGSSLKHIGEKAFSKCIFVDIWLPDSVATIGNQCFLQSRVCRVGFSRNSKLVSIGRRAFEGTPLKEFIVPDSVVEIGESCFLMGKLSCLVFGKDSKLSRIGNGILSDCSTLLCLPESVKEIGEFGCFGVKALSLGLHPSLEVVGKSCFAESLVRENQLPPSVVSIPSYCYHRCQVLEVAFQPNSAIREVLSYAFAYCSQLQEVVIPDTVAYLGNQCFGGCEQLHSVKWGPHPTVTTIGHEAFAGTSISKFRFPGTVTSVGGGMFNDCPLTNLDVSAVPTILIVQGSFLLSADLTTLYEVLAETLNSVHIPDTVTCLEDYLFTGSQISEVTFGPNSQLTRIGNCVFAETPVQEIDIPAGVTEIGDECFSGCDSNRRLAVFAPYSSLTLIGRNAFADGTVGEFIIPDTVVDIGLDCWQNARDMRRIKFSGSYPSLCRLSKRLFAWILWSGCPGKSMEDFVIPDSVVEIGSECFGCFGEIGHLNFSPLSNVVRIGKAAFAHLSLKEIFIPDSVVFIASSCFFNCSLLERVTFGRFSSLISIEDQVFEGCALTSIVIPSQVAKLGCRCFHRCPLSTVAFAEHSQLGQILDRSFEMSIFEAINLPDSVVEIADEAFVKCIQLRSITFGPNSSLIRMGEMAFMGSELQAIKIPASVTEIGSYCFCKLQTLEFVTFEDGSSLAFIGYGAFGSSGLKEITIPDTVNVIGERCFYKCSNLSRVTIGDKSLSVGKEATTGQVIEDSAFEMCQNLSNVSLSSSSLSRIGRCAFRETAITSLWIPGSVTEIGDSCFANCHNLANVEFGPDSLLSTLGVDVFADCPLLSAGH